MKVLFVTFFQIISFTGCCQSLRPDVEFPLSKDCIVKFKISKITIKTSESPDYIMDFYLDKYGNDTALYINGVMLWMKEYHRNKSGRIIECIQYDSSRVEEVIEIYRYEKNGFYMVEKRYKKYESISQSETYNKDGKIQSEFLIDGGSHIYKYDSLGRLSKIDSKPGLDGYDFFRAEYRYNAKNILQSIKGERFSPASFEYLIEFFYDLKGLLVRSEQVEIYSSNHKYLRTTFYSYLFR